jgi:hypothetical protein
MAQYRIPHPYNPHYAIPSYILAEPPGQRQAIVTAQAPRGTFSSPPVGWAGGFKDKYALPAYVQAEPHKRGAMSTYYVPRKTIPTLVPEYLSGLGDAAVPKPGFSGDPFKAYGIKATEIILNSIATLPDAEKADGMKAALDAIESGLWERTIMRLEEYRGKHKGVSDKKLVRWALSSALSEGLAKKVIALGKGESPTPTSLGFSIGDIFKPIGKAVSGVGKIGGKIAGKVGGLACKVLKSDVAKIGGAAVSTVYTGNPAIGAAGVQVASGMCPAGTVPMTQAEMMAAQAPARPPWLIPAAVGAGGLILVLLLTRK